MWNIHKAIKVIFIHSTILDRIFFKIPSLLLLSPYALVKFSASPLKNPTHKYQLNKYKMQEIVDIDCIKWFNIS